MHPAQFVGCTVAPVLRPLCGSTTQRWGFSPVCDRPGGTLAKLHQPHCAPRPAMGLMRLPEALGGLPTPVGGAMATLRPATTFLTASGAVLPGYLRMNRLAPARKRACMAYLRFIAMCSPLQVRPASRYPVRLSGSAVRQRALQSRFRGTTATQTAQQRVRGTPTAPA